VLNLLNKCDLQYIYYICTAFLCDDVVGDDDDDDDDSEIHVLLPLLGVHDGGHLMLRPTLQVRQMVMGSHKVQRILLQQTVP